jgi:hypothetical protein
VIPQRQLGSVVVVVIRSLARRQVEARMNVE